MKFRCSSLGKLMTEPRSKSEGVLSVGAKTYIRELAAQEIFGVEFEVSSKAIEKGIEVVSLDLPVRNLSSAEGKLMLQMFSAFAEFEKSRIIERTKEGLVRARKEGKKLGRPGAADTLQRVQEARAKGLSQSKAALALNLSLPTIKRNWNIKEA